MVTWSQSVEKGRVMDGSFRGDQIGAPWEQGVPRPARSRRGDAAARVALHRGAEAPADGVGHPRRIIGSIGEEAQRNRAGPLPAGPREGLERRTVANVPDQAERRFRPRARRARSTARPPLVRIRRRKPWVLARLRLFGWYVRFTGRAPSRRSRAARSRGPSGRRKRHSVRVRPPPTQRGAPRIASLGKTLAAPCRTRTPVLRCAPRSALGLLSCSSWSVAARPGRTRATHLGDLHTCGLTCGQHDGGRDDHP